MALSPAYGKGVENMAHFIDGFMSVTDRLRFLFGPATRVDSSLPVVHRHDEFEQASEEELTHFMVESDSEGHHYAVRRDDLQNEA
jgi:hypothetical protein